MIYTLGSALESLFPAPRHHHAQHTAVFSGTALRCSHYPRRSNRCRAYISDKYPRHIESIPIYANDSARMADRTCPKCGKKFEFPSRLAQHLSRKTSCVDTSHPLNGMIPIDPTKPHRCPYCGKGFATPQGKFQHKSRCSKRADDQESIEIILRDQTAKMAHLQRELDLLKLRQSGLLPLQVSPAALPSNQFAPGPAAGVTPVPSAPLEQTTPSPEIAVVVDPPVSSFLQ